MPNTVRTGLIVAGLSLSFLAGSAITAAHAHDGDRPRARTAALLTKIAECESGGDPTAVSPDGRYRGKYQFSRATWRAMGGSGDPADASEREQDRRAAKLLRVQGRSAWPTCGAGI